MKSLTTLIVLLLAPLATLHAAQIPAPANRPNIVVVFADNGRMRTGIGRRKLRIENEFSPASQPRSGGSG